MIVVTNSGPLIALGKLVLLDILSKLYKKVKLPTSVYNEVVIKGQEFGCLDAIIVQRAINQGDLLVTDMCYAELPKDIASLPLEIGEKEAIYLAIREKADLLLLDDMVARSEANSYNLGVIVQAYRTGFLNFDELEAFFEMIISSDDIWISEGICRRILIKLQSEKKK